LKLGKCGEVKVRDRGEAFKAATDRRRYLLFL
jgi:hypothetical protein